MMTPATYSAANSAGIHPANSFVKNSQPRKAIENGLTSQFTKRVTNRPVGRRPTPRIDAKSIFSIIG